MARSIASEQGSVLVTTAMILPVVILLLVLVVDVGNWFEHRRHLQLQADAAALAAAGDVRFPCDNAPIRAKAAEYGGELHNEQVGGGQSRVSMAINSATYPGTGNPGPTDSDVREGEPCDVSMIDVKLTETDLPFFFGLGNVDFINAHARVEINQADSLAGLLPVAVPEASPERVRVTFINEANGETLGATDLVRTGATPDGLAMWDNAGAPVSVTVADGVHDIGMRVTLSGATSTTCGDPLVECYDSGSTNGLVYARGWSGASQVTGDTSAPRAYSVSLGPGSCSDAYFSIASSTCTVGVQADVKFRGSAGDPTADLGASVTAEVGGDSYPLAFDSTTGRWESGAVIPVDAAAGPVPITLEWKRTKGTINGSTCKTGGNNPCEGSFGVVQRTFAATDARSGPIHVARISENGTSGANSFETCSSSNSTCTRELVAHIGIKGSLEVAQDVSDPIVELRVVGGSQNQTLDCDPDVNNFVEEIAQGCAPEYGRNTGTACPDSVQTLWDSPQPWQCVAVQTGTARNMVSRGLNERILGDRDATTCTNPNRWSEFPDLDPGDPRIVQLIVTPFGAFNGSGNDTVPVQNFAAFYVTGWDGNGNGGRNVCRDEGDDPVPGGGYIVGHFINYVQRVNNGGGGSTPCNATTFGICIAQLTR